LEPGSKGVKKELLYMAESIALRGIDKKGLSKYYRIAAWARRRIERKSVWEAG